MSNFTLGRIGLTVDMNDVAQFDHSGSRVSVAFSTDFGTLAEANAIRQQLLGYVDHPDETFVPVTWTDDPEVDGFYRVLSAEVAPDPDVAFDGVYYFAAELERVAGYAAAQIESVVVHVEKAHTVTAIPNDALFGLPVAVNYSVIYDPSDDTYSHFTVSGGDLETETGTVDRIDLASASSPCMVQYQIAPANYYVAAAVLKVAGKVAVGRQIINDPDNWELSNGLLKITPNVAGGDFGLSVSSWDQASLGWNTPWDLVFVGASTASRIDLAQPSAITVLRNTPEEVSIRLITKRAVANPVPIMVDLSIRRGEEWVSGRYTIADDVWYPGIRSATLAGDLSGYDKMGWWAFGGAVNATGWNLSTNPRLGVNATGWANVGGIGTATGRQSGTGPIAEIDEWWRATASAAHGAATFGVEQGGVTGENAVTPGQVVSPSIYARCSVARSVSMRYTFYTAGGAIVGTTTTVAAVALAANTWTRLSVANVTVPATAARMVVDVVGSSTAWAAGQTLDVTGVFIELAATVGAAYKDGYSSSAGLLRYRWAGTPHNSATQAWTLVSGAQTYGIAALDPLTKTSDQIHPTAGNVIAWDFALAKAEYPTTPPDLDEKLRDWLNAVSSRPQVVAV